MDKLKRFWKKQNEKRKAYRRVYYLKNKQRMIDNATQWRKDNLERSRSILKKYEDKRRIAGRKQSVNGNRKRTFVRDSYTCQICFKRFDIKLLDVHHLDGKGSHYREKGGEPNNKLSNLQTLCQSCHGKLHRLKYLKSLES